MNWMDVVVDAVDRFVPAGTQRMVLEHLTTAAQGPATRTRRDAGPMRRLEFTSVDLTQDREAIRGLFSRGWPAWRRWYLGRGDKARPSLSRCRTELRRHMPELVPVWERLTSDLAPGDPVAARFLSQYDPPPLFSGCSHLVLEEPALLRNYDYDPELFDGLVTRSRYLRPVVGTSDQAWGLLDGVNDAGLAASFTFGGRVAHGPGFGIPLVIRYILETCETVDEAVAVLRRVPVHVPYNVTVVDAQGDHATVFVGPDRAAAVTRARATTNHQESVDWPEHSARVGSESRLTTLSETARESVDREAGVECMLSPAVRAERYDEGFGTLYTAVLLPAQGAAEYRWPGSTWTLSCDSFEEGTHVVEVPEVPSGWSRWYAPSTWDTSPAAGAPSARGKTCTPSAS